MPAYNLLQLHWAYCPSVPAGNRLKDWAWVRPLICLCVPSAFDWVAPGLTMLLRQAGAATLHILLWRPHSETWPIISPCV